MVQLRRGVAISWHLHNPGGPVVRATGGALSCPCALVLGIDATQARKQANKKASTCMARRTGLTLGFHRAPMSGGRPPTMCALFPQADDRGGRCRRFGWVKDNWPEPERNERRYELEPKSTAVSCFRCLKDVGPRSIVLQQVFSGTAPLGASPEAARDSQAVQGLARDVSNIRVFLGGRRGAHRIHPLHAITGIPATISRRRRRWP